MLKLAIQNLKVSYQGLPTPALNIESLVLEPAVRVALVGPSGCGKTTFLNVITGMEQATEGSVVWDEDDLARFSQSRRDKWRARNVGLIMQDFHLFPGMSAFDNVLLPQRLARHGSSDELQSYAHELLERVGIERPRQNVETMSRGQMQRVAVARALVHRPSLIIADEPTASLDAESGHVVADLLTSLARETAATLIVATHDPHLIADLDGTLKLANGQLQA